MVFKRRDKRPIWKSVALFFWPQGGWARAFRYVHLRVGRLPDPPHRIARGIFAGVFITFSPLFGMHFLFAASLAWIVRGNIIAALLATFVGNPLTFLAIATASLQTGHYLLGTGKDLPAEMHRSLGGKFMDAGEDLRHNFWAMFTPETAHWDSLSVFYHDVFLPYLVGGIIPGLVCGIIAYYVSLPLLNVYQKRRKARLTAKWHALKHKAKVSASALPPARKDRDHTPPA
ncbi:DUF2062 domain-containing protein [Rhodobacteraceae bacterium KMM 6894]|nr:DUF2062 domain-containing protein [Rhodobacteraceae bacterium KMM 6894]